MVSTFGWWSVDRCLVVGGRWSVGRRSVVGGRLVGGFKKTLFRDITYNFLKMEIKTKKNHFLRFMQRPNLV